MTHCTYTKILPTRVHSKSDDALSKQYVYPETEAASEYTHVYVRKAARERILSAINAICLLKIKTKKLIRANYCSVINHVNEKRS